MKESFSTKKAVLIGDAGATKDGSTKTQTYLRCLKKGQFAYVRGVMVPKSNNPSYFSVGSIFGACRAAWFGMKFAMGGKAWVHIKHAAQKEAERNKLPILPQDESYALALFQMYVDYWSVRPMPRPVATELNLVGQLRLDRTGSLDDLSQYPEAGMALAIGECKTTSGDIASTIREYEFHVQTLQYQTLYMLNVELQKKWGPVAGHLLDITKKPEGKGKKPSFDRTFIEFRRPALLEFIRSTQLQVKGHNKIKWDDDVVRSYQCTYQAGRARVDCEYKPLCRLGKSASARYVLANGKPLNSHVPKPGQEKMPWE